MLVYTPALLSHSTPLLLLLFLRAPAAPHSQPLPDSKPLSHPSRPKPIPNTTYSKSVPHSPTNLPFPLSKAPLSKSNTLTQPKPKAPNQSQPSKSLRATAASSAAAAIPMTHVTFSVG